MEYFHEMKCPLGDIAAASDGEALTGLWFAGQRHYPPDSRTALWRPSPGLYVFKDLGDWLADYFAGHFAASPPLLAPRGTDFQRAVWDMLLKIPRGQTWSYGELAALLKSSPRAVGSAVGRNPISILIPCHRVLGATGDLTGYAGGLDRKIYLLKHEGAVLL